MQYDNNRHSGLSLAKILLGRAGELIALFRALALTSRPHPTISSLRVWPARNGARRYHLGIPRRMGIMRRALAGLTLIAFSFATIAPSYALTSSADDPALAGLSEAPTAANETPPPPEDDRSPAP